MIFNNFDFSVLDNPLYKEDAVREDIVSPILRALGYKESGPIRMERSKNLIHPFVKIGSKSNKIYIIPDYILYFEDTPLLILDAKSPSEKIQKSEHVEQAFSYAIHPDIRAHYYGLCNGRYLVIYSLLSWDPLLNIPVQEIDARWDTIYKALAPQYLRHPYLRTFMPDYGLALKKVGYKDDLKVFTYDFHWHDIILIEDGLYTSSSTCLNGDFECIVSFDYDKNILNRIIDEIPSDIAEVCRKHLSRQPFRVDLEGKVIVSSGGILGKIIQGQYEQFVPIILNEIVTVRYDKNVVLEKYKAEQPH